MRLMSNPSARPEPLQALDVAFRNIVSTLSGPPLSLNRSAFIVQVLAGVVILFSRIIPLEHEPESHPLWRLAVRFGARCAKGMNADVTHVVANVAGTEKVS